MKRIIIILLVVCFNNLFYSITDSEIGNFLKNYEEEGYQFKKQVNKYSWLVSFGAEDWEKAVDVYVYLSKNKNNPSYDMIYVFSVLADSIKSIPYDLLELMLNANNLNNNWGNFAVSYNDDNTRMIAYVIKLKQNQTDSNELIRAIGYIAGYSYESVKTINKYLK